MPVEKPYLLLPSGLRRTPKRSRAPIDQGVLNLPPVIDDRPYMFMPRRVRRSPQRPIPLNVQDELKL